ncbi:MAG: bifunctional oligoribonuclease/PAP phosphatase NrnA [Peptostreptococcaceae bacterium]|nr:bifunctional oligoribonuclease/PAP phosphatase NrnA [Peptostreptococcaceae bacterium]
MTTKTMKTKNKEIQQEMEMMAAKLLSVNSVLLFPHVNMDGDCLGSSVALCKGLRLLGKKAYVLIEDEIPTNLSFLDNSYCTFNQNIIENPDICMTVDCAEIERFAKRKEKFLEGETLMCIDHHSTSKSFADYNLIDPAAAATGELVYKLLLKMRAPLDAEIGEALYAAISTDTGNFQYSNTTKETHQIIANLYDLGINHSKVSVKIYQNIRREKLMMTSISLSTMKLLLNGRVAIAFLRQKALTDTGATMDEAEGIVETLRSISGVEVAIFLKETEKGMIKVSMRAKKDFDVAKFSAKFGGGGHVKAAGFTMNEPIEKCADIISEEIILDMTLEQK